MYLYIIHKKGNPLMPCKPAKAKHLLKARKAKVIKGDYQQTKGSHSEKGIPTGKLFGLRKFDYIQTPKGIGFVKDKRGTGFFAISDVEGKVINPSVHVKKDCTRLKARKTALTERRGTFLQGASPVVSCA